MVIRRYRAGLLGLLSVLVAAAAWAAGTTTFEYDEAGRLNKATYPGNVPVTYTLDPAGNRTQVLMGDTTLPSVPAGVSATAASATQINVSWSASTDNVGVASYRIYRNGGTTPHATVSSLTFSDAGLTQLTTYSYQVSAVDTAGNESAKSASVSRTTPDGTAPSVPSGVSATPVSPTQINLAWSASTDNVAVTGYRIYRNGSSTPLTTVTATSYSDTLLANSTTYSYRISARDAAGNESALSTSVSATTPVPPDTTAPTTPGSLSATAPSSNQVNLSWSASTDTGGSLLAGYKIFRNGTQIGTAGSSATTYSDTTVSGSTAYSYTVQAYDNAGNHSGQSNTAGVTTPDTIAPTTPGGLSASAPSSGQVNLSWSASTDSGGSGLAGYRIYRNGSHYTTTTSTSYSDTGVVGTTSYSYYIVAYDGVGNTSGQSNTASVTTPDTIAPSTPTGLSASAPNGSQVNLSWSGSSDTGGSGLAGYRIYRNGSHIATTGATSYSDTTVAMNVTYSYTVAAYDNANNASGQSSAASVTTPYNWITLTNSSWQVLPAHQATYSCSQTFEPELGFTITECHINNPAQSIVYITTWGGWQMASGYRFASGGGLEVRADRYGVTP